MLPILIVDDEPQLRCLLNRLLVKNGFLPIEAEDRDCAVCAAREQCGRLAAVLTDIELGSSNGIDAAKAIRAEFPGMPVIFVSSAAVQAEELERDVPGCVFVKKPFVPSELIQTLRSVLGAQGTGATDHML